MFFNLIYFFAPFSIFYIPHNYVIPQAMPHAIPQTHSAFYLHRVWRTQHDLLFFGFEHQYGRRDVMWKHSIQRCTRSSSNRPTKTSKDKENCRGSKLLPDAILSNLFLASVFCKTLCRVWQNFLVNVKLKNRGRRADRGLWHLARVKVISWSL